ncbi:GPW/gp25 family protein [Ottowia sp. SB7-C50]|uniref:GPW/gp25 family protein n=1 Tax=Ottowia sp. SB7-C50 TaxID=3081231 RepID=UPI002953F630|nr:GPW/gp25 family protein [Ottowia sp. SB7-C50]WOP14664.1 GPW/gp25 family protein [Ottowia sp. SB7-C50]
MNRATGQALSGVAHLTQSVADILLTPIGSRVMRRGYGSLVPELVDQPDNAATRLRLRAAVAGALMRWEPRLRVERVQISPDPARPGRALVLVEATLLTLLAPGARPLTLSVPLQTGAAP